MPSLLMVTSLYETNIFHRDVKQYTTIQPFIYLGYDKLSHDFFSYTREKIINFYMKIV